MSEAAPSTMAASMYWPLPERVRSNSAHDPEGSHEAAAREVGDQVEGWYRGAPAVTDLAQHAGDGDVVDVVPCRLGERPGLAVTGDRAVDDRRVELRERRVVAAQARGHSRPVAFEEDVGGLGQAQEHPAPAVGLEVQRQAAIVARENVARAHLGQRIVDPDHVGPHVAEQHGAVGPGRQAGEVEDPDAGQRPEGGGRLRVDHARWQFIALL
jgi:hypothetical protein